MTYKAKILLVDNDVDFVDMNRAVLEHSGYEVVTATNGLAALDACHPHEIDLVITDYEMPYLNGRQLCQQLLLKRKDLPIIVSTAKYGITEELAQTWGAKALVTKPYSFEELVGVIKRYCF